MPTLEEYRDTAQKVVDSWPREFIELITISVTDNKLTINKLTITIIKGGLSSDGVLFSNLYSGEEGRITKKSLIRQFPTLEAWENDLRKRMKKFIIDKALQ